MPARPKPAPTTHVLENRWLKLDLISHGAGLKKITFKQHQNYGTNGDGTGPVEIVTWFRNADRQMVPALALEGVPGLPPDAAFDCKSQNLDRVVFEAETPAGLLIRKTIVLGSESDYSIQLLVELANRSQGPVFAEKPALGLGPMSPLSDIEKPIYTGFDFLRADKVIHKRADALQKKPFEAPGPIAWASIRNQFFVLIVQPENAPGTSLFAQITPDSAITKTRDQLFASLALEPINLPAGQTVSRPFKIYAGPKELKRLEALGDQKDEVMEFNIWGLRLFGAITKILLSILVWVNSLVHNFGWSIVIVTILIKILFWYPSSVATKSMKKMQALQPKINALKEKYKDDPNKQNIEMMKLYKEYKINPLGGCLPLLLQIPVSLLLSLLSALALAFILSERLAAPLGLLAESTRAVAQGDFSRRHPVRSHDEKRTGRNRGRGGDDVKGRQLIGGYCQCKRTHCRH